MIASVAAVSERPVQVFVSMNAVLAFRKDADGNDRYQGGAFSRLMLEKKAPDAMMLFEQGKELGDLTMHVCSMALDVMGAEVEDMIDGLFDGILGLTKFLSDSEDGELITL